MTKIFNNLTIPLLTGALLVSVIINILLVKRLKRTKPKAAQSLKSTHRFLQLLEEDDITEEEVNSVLELIIQEVKEDQKKNSEDHLKRGTS